MLPKNESTIKKKICYANKKGNVIIKLFIAINSPKFPSYLGKLSLQLSPVFYNVNIG